jgi:hypothetical protein
VAGAQEEEPARKYLLKETAPVMGDVTVVERSEDETLEIYATPRGMEAQIPEPTKFGRHLRERFTETVLALDKEGQITQLQRVYTAARTQQTAGTLDPPKNLVHGRQGKTVTLKRVNGKTVVTVANGKLSAAETRELARELDRAGVLNLFPDQEVSPDDEWDVEEARVVKAFGMEHGTLKVHFIEVKPFRGHPCARLSLDLQLEGKDARGPISWNLEGTTFFAVDLQRTLYAKYSGPVSTMGVGKAEGHIADLAGEGIGEMTVSRNVIKKGKLPPKPAEPAPVPGAEPAAAPASKS